MSDTPETDKAERMAFSQEYMVPTDFARKLERERDEARDALSEISLYLSSGIGGETTTAQQYKERILEGIKMLTDPIMDKLRQARSERDEARQDAQNYYLKVVELQQKLKEYDKLKS